MPKPRAGFTLIELSIVLVIIGLLVGGILVGRELIAAAQIRKFITSLEQYNTAVFAFKNKYGGLPGDLKNGTSFGFSANGNNDGCVGACALPQDDTPIGGFSGGQDYEMPLFWQELGLAGLVSGQYDGDPVIAGDTVGRTFPRVSYNATIGMLLYYGDANQPINSHFYTPVRSASGGFSVPISPYPGSLSAAQAFQVDTKIDDGGPGSGIVLTLQDTDGFINEVTRDGIIGTAPSLPLNPATDCAFIPAGGGTHWFYHVDGTVTCTQRFQAPF